MIEILIEEGQEKVRLLRGIETVQATSPLLIAKSVVCLVTAIREDERGFLHVDVVTPNFLILKNLAIGEDCEFTDKAMNYPTHYRKMLIYV